METAFKKMKISIKTKTLKFLGSFTKRSKFAENIVRRLIHLYAIINSGRFTRGSLCIIEDKSQNLLLVETIYKVGKGFVGGLPDSRHEQPKDTATREILEEIGLEVQGELKFIGTYVQKYIRHIDAVFYYQIPQQELEQIIINDGELAATSWHTHANAYDLLDEDGQAIMDLFKEVTKETI